jgi:hypothetical protein
MLKPARRLFSYPHPTTTHTQCISEKALPKHVYLNKKRRQCRPQYCVMLLCTPSVHTKRKENVIHKGDVAASSRASSTRAATTPWRADG